LFTISRRVGCNTGNSEGSLPLNIYSHLLISVEDAGAIAHQSRDHREFTPLVDRGHRVARGKRNEPVALAIAIRIAADEKRSNSKPETKRMPLSTSMALVAVNTSTGAPKCALKAAECDGVACADKDDRKNERHLFRGTPRMGAADGDDYWHLPGDKVRCQR
jgi:hypothetical protein